MRIWIDFSNSPHPLLFAPVIRRLESQGHSVLLTARDNAQTIELARERWPDVAVIGGTSPKGKPAKARAMGRRVADLCRWARAARPDVALSHNSYGQLVAARLMRIPAVTAMDYEHQPANHLAFRLADIVLLPTALERSVVRRQGASPRKTRYYAGLKEELYLADFEPDSDILGKLGVPHGPDDVVVVARPAPDQATYHAFENPLFLSCVQFVLRDPKVTVVALPRHEAQRQALNGLGLSRCVVADRAVDSRSLMSRADLMIGAGGTMTREAALMGVPTVSLFAGHRPAVDQWLEHTGAMRIISRAEELPSLEPRPRIDRLAHLRERGDTLVGDFCDAVSMAVGTP